MHAGITSECCEVLLCSLYHVQLPRRAISVTSRLPVKAAPTSRAHGTLWMANTTPVTSKASICITRAGPQAHLGHYISLTDQQLRMLVPLCTPPLWEA